MTQAYPRAQLSDVNALFLKSEAFKRLSFVPVLDDRESMRTLVYQFKTACRTRMEVLERAEKDLLTF